jgi:acyl-coenzyme A thioesterase PaaI-like protein
MNSTTHLAIDPRLVGEPVQLGPGVALARLVTSPEMAADGAGLVHGGFVFGLADYAAMLAVNHPHVVLGGAEVRFLAPVRCGDLLEAHAEVTGEAGKKRTVHCRVTRAGTDVFSGHFTCFVLDRHVLAV